jgi:uncharacterized protein YqjF (DUF2071 family)
MVFKSRPQLNRNHMKFKSAYRRLNTTESTPRLEAWLQVGWNIFQEETQ